VLGDLGIDPSQAMFFEDSLKNVLAGAELGMATVFVTGMTADEEGFNADNERQIDIVVSTLTDGGAELRAKIPALFAQ
jgi:FMN phosphatase YigB (HAD superfamily)